MLNTIGGGGTMFPDGGAETFWQVECDECGAIFSVKRVSKAGESHKGDGLLPKSIKCPNRSAHRELPRPKA